MSVIPSSKASQVRYDSEGRPEVGDLEAMNLNITGEDVEYAGEGVMAVSRLTSPPEPEAPAGPKGRKRKTRAKETPRIKVALSGHFGDSTIMVESMSKGAPGSGIALALSSGPEGFAYVPPPGGASFEASVLPRGERTMVVHAGIRFPTPGRGQGEETLVLLAAPQ